MSIADIVEASSLPVIRKTIAPGSFLVVQGDPLKAVYLISSGLVKLFRSGKDGKEMLIGLMGENELLGEVEFFLGDPLFCHIQCILETELLEIEYSGFKSLVDGSPEFRDELFRSLSQRLRELSFRTSDAFSLSTEELLLTLIRENSRRGINFTRKMYADYLGMSERSVNRAIRRLEERGVLCRNRQSLFVPE